MDWCENFDLDSSIPLDNYMFTVRRYRYKNSFYENDHDNNNLRECKKLSVSSFFRPSSCLRGSTKKSKADNSKKKVDFQESAGILYTDNNTIGNKSERVAVVDSVNTSKEDSSDTSKMGIQKLKKKHKVFIRKSATLPSHKEAERCIFMVGFIWNIYISVP